ncbi:hypothetical protein HELRODRAFT_194783 [Helobdella robusta]|uniref:protein O-GlcNAcase n=1 Tax=Helobdella robusta TaxID=6412 RepID=T1FWE7_HELRO|nr:hypothetical protein HELRODRAFT_194783 [Helobdella robusta]ESN89820.1 hypothetical protein HELRODRAFT_194783 [Helobdella robusta]
MADIVFVWGMGWIKNYAPGVWGHHKFPKYRHNKYQMQIIVLNRKLFNFGPTIRVIYLANVALDVINNYIRSLIYVTKILLSKIFDGFLKIFCARKMNKNAPTSPDQNCNKSFLCGVCEGFYGKPWSFSQRQELFKRMQRFGMNTYLYAPKDDYKHRLYWREMYNEEEADELKCLIRFSVEYCINFVYALSPGLDIIYSSDEEVTILKKKLDQVKNLGCTCFSLLFDDIEDDLCREDMHKFASIADAQCYLTNEIYEHLGRPDLFLFCPTEYCTSRSIPDVSKSPYLRTIGQKLQKNIDFLWTGPKVVSRRITVESIEELSTVVKRPVTIWDNLHANDYDQTRIYLGPYTGRPAELIGRLRGVLTNPNCEFEANFVALHTLAQWTMQPATNANSRTEADMEVEDIPTDPTPPNVTSSGIPQTSSTLLPIPTSPYPAHPATYAPPENDVRSDKLEEYEPRRALQMAILDWLPELYRFKSSFGHKNPIEKTLNLADSKNAADLAKFKESDVSKSSEDVEFEVVEQRSQVYGATATASSSALVDSAGNIVKEKEDEDDGPKQDEDVAMLEEEEPTQPPPISTSDANINSNKEQLSKESLANNIGTTNFSTPTSKTMATTPQQQQQQQSNLYQRSQHDSHLTSEDLTMVCDFFYLPFEHGPTGEHMLKVARWLVDNFHLVYKPNPYPVPFAAYIPHPPPLPQTSQPHPSLVAAGGTASCASPPCDDRSAYSTSPESPVVVDQRTVSEAGKKVSEGQADVIPPTNKSTPSLEFNKISPSATHLKDRFLGDNYFLPSSASEWYERAIRFHDGYGDLSGVVDKLVNIPNRELLYEIYKYVNDMRSNLALVNSYIRWHVQLFFVLSLKLGIDKREKELFKSGEQEPWVHRGGLLAEFRRLLPFERDANLARSNNVFVVRPYYAADKGHVNMICLRTHNDMMDATFWLGSVPDLVGDCFLGTFLKFFSKFAYVLEDNLGICSYVVAADSYSGYDDHLMNDWLPQMRTKYPMKEDRKTTQMTSATMSPPLATAAAAAAATTTVTTTASSDLASDKKQIPETSTTTLTTQLPQPPTSPSSEIQPSTHSPDNSGELEGKKSELDQAGHHHLLPPPSHNHPHHQHGDDICGDDDDDDGPYPMSSSSSTEHSRTASPDNDLYRRGYLPAFPRPRFSYHNVEILLQTLHTPTDSYNFNSSQFILPNYATSDKNIGGDIISADATTTATTEVTTVTTAATTVTNSTSISSTPKIANTDSVMSVKEFLSKYPSIIQIGLSRGRGSPAKLLLASAEQALANSGSTGMHVVLPSSYRSTVEMYKNLGFHEQKLKLNHDDQKTKNEGENIGGPGMEDRPAAHLQHVPNTDLSNIVILCKAIDIEIISSGYSENVMREYAAGTDGPDKTKSEGFSANNPEVKNTK